MLDTLLIAAGDMLLALTSMIAYCFYNRIELRAVFFKITLFTALSGLYAGLIFAPNLDDTGFVALVLVLGFDIKFFVWNILLGKRFSLPALYIAYTTLSVEAMVSSIPELAIKTITGRDAGLRTEWLISIAIVTIMLLILFRIVHSEKRDSVVATLKKITHSVYLLLVLLMQVMESMLSIIGMDSEKFRTQRQVYQFLTILFFVLLIVVIMALVINNLAQTQYKEISRLLEKQVQDQVSHYQEQLRMDEELKRFRHDYRNHIRCIGSLMHSGAMADALDYITRITEQMDFNTKRFDTGNELVNAILGEKERLAAVNHIAFSATGFFHPAFNVTDTCIILTNALDNAVEACRKLDKYRFISVELSVHKPYQIISIKNSAGAYSGLSTSKADKENHGFGLENIARAVKTYDGTMLPECENGIFSLNITLKIE